MKKNDFKDILKQYKQYSSWLQHATLDNLYKETEEEKIKRIEQLLLPQNYTTFFDYYFGTKTHIPLADSQCAWFHQKSYENIFKNNYITQFRLWFRGAAKSIHSNVGNVIALKQNNKVKFFLLVGINEKRAKQLLADLQAQFENNQRLINDFGNQITYGNWSDGVFETSDGCFFMALGIEQPFRGLRNYANRLDLVSIDDVEDRKVAKNERLVQERVEKIMSDLMPAFGKDSQRIIISNNLIEKKGIVGSLMQKLNNKYSDILKVDIVDQNGNPQWKERYSKADIVRIKQMTDNNTWLREYMNTPVDEGKIFKPEWIKFKKIENFQSYKNIIGHWDLSYTTEGDYKAFVLLGNTGTEMHVLDIFCRKCDINEAIEYHFNLAKALQKNGIAAMFFYDATAAQEAVFMPIFQQKAFEFQTYAIPLPTRANVDKYLRIEATLTSVFYNKKIFFSDTILNNPDWEDAKFQLLSFEKGSAAHDDFPDTLEAAVRISQENTGFNTFYSFEPIIQKHKLKGW